MLDFQAARDLWTIVQDVSRYHVDWTAWPDPRWMAGGAAVIGFVLAFWGGRVLRAFYVLAFMAVGAAVGKRVADTLQVDLLIGLVLGAGFVGLIGYLFYRWWVGLTMGLMGALLVLGLFASPQIEPVIRTFNDARTGAGTGSYDTVLSQPERQENVQTYLRELWAYCWGEQRAVVYRTLGPAALAGLLGLAVGVILPRLATILATSVLGVAALVGGGGYLLWLKWPNLWGRVEASPTWSIGLLVGLLVVSLLYQASHSGRRPVPAAAAAPVPAA